MDKLENIIHYLSNKFLHFSLILVGMIFLCLILYGLTVLFLLYFNNIVSKVIGGVISIVFTVVLLITKLLSVFWGILIIIKIIEKFF